MIIEKTHPWITFSINLSRAPAKLWAILGECNALCRYISELPLLPDARESLFNEYLAHSTAAVLAVEGKVLAEDEIKRLITGDLNLPPSKKYLAQESENFIDGIRRILDYAGEADHSELSPEIIKKFNQIILDRLVLSGNVVPGKIRKNDSDNDGEKRKLVPCEDCESLIENLCEWLNSKTFFPPPGMSIVYGILKAVLAHLYLGWIRPFAAGDRRTTYLVESHILVSSGIPPLAASLLSIHYTQTRSEYHRQIKKASRPDGKVLPFIVYAVEGLRDGLHTLIDTVQNLQADALWSHFIHEIFRDKTSPADLRRRELALELSMLSEPVKLSQLKKAVPHSALAYAARTYKTLTRDVNELISMGILEKTPDGVRARKESVRDFSIIN